ncbi:MAG TPA: TonB-dependent receptor, partial [Longimicrobiales bacterium]|nr:TonB-dependent receptor [Longimicrobiales bacterium]
MNRNLALALALCAAAPAAAQTPPDTFRLGEIVVTATRTPQPRAAVPAHVTVLDGAALRARGIARVADALRDAGAGSMAQGGAPGAAASLFLRGGESDYVQVLIDGVQVNEPGGSYDWAHLSTADVERIEIVRGPVSVLYGSDAVAGVVQIFTRTGAGPVRLDAELGAATGGRVGPEASGSFASWDGALSLGGASRVAGRPLGWTLLAARQWSGGAYAYNNEYGNSTLSARGRYGLGPGTVIALNGRYIDQRFHYPTDGAGRLVDRNRFTDGTAHTLSVALEQRLTPALHALLTLASYRNQTGGDDPADEPEQGFSRSSARVRRDAVELRLDAALARQFVLSVGGELEEQHGRTWFESDGPFGPYRDRSSAERGNRAAYAQLVGRVARLTLTGGTRIDHSDQFGDFATGRIGVTADLGSGLAGHAAWGTGFKEPTFFETYATGFARGNPALTPERSRSGELGLRLTAGPLRLGATAFDQRFRNLIQYTAAPPSADAPNYFNVGAARARGLEADASVRGEHIQLAASYTLLDTEVLDHGFGTDPQFQAGATLLRRPAHQGVIGIDWTGLPRLT